MEEKRKNKTSYLKDPNLETVFLYFIEELEQCYNRKQFCFTNWFQMFKLKFFVIFNSKQALQIKNKY